MTTWKQILQLAKTGNNPPDRRVEKSDDEWKVQLSSDQFHVARRGGTEGAFSSGMCTAFEAAIYDCVCCGTTLFDSTFKFDSGTGWPSFTEAVEENVVSYHSDVSYGMVRVEVTCSICDAHLGHVFPDGPEENELRYCINALSLAKSADS